MIRKPGGERPGAQPGDAPPSVRWDGSNWRSLSANVVNFTGTREDLVLLFGVLQVWQSRAKAVPVQLLDHIILNPHAAKPFNLLLTRVLQGYEAHYGPLPIENAAASAKVILHIRARP